MPRSARHISSQSSSARFAPSTGSVDSAGAPGAARFTGLKCWCARHRAGLVATLLFIATAAICSVANSFPYYYEKDAPGKVAQVLTGERNYYHPLLMLNAADAAMRFLRIPRTEQDVVMTGRWLMVLCCASSVAAFSLLGARLAGMAGAFCGAVLIATHPLLFDLAHHFKEDPVLLAGMAFTLLAMQAFYDAPSKARAAWLGLACAIALSGKYVGIAAPLLAIGPLCAARIPPHGGMRRRDAWLCFGLALFAATAFFNRQILLQPSAFDAGFASEIGRLTRPEKVGQLPQTAKVVEACRVLFPVPILVFAAWQIARMLMRRSRRWLVAWLGLGFVLVFLAVLLWTPRLYTRHFLPLVAIVVFFAGLGIAHAAQAACSRVRGLSEKRHAVWVAIGIAAIVYAGWFHHPLRNAAKPYRHPTRERMLSWIAEKLPPNAVIAADLRAFLVKPDGSPREDFPIPQRVIVRNRLREFDGFSEMVRLGATHIVAHSLASPEYFKKVKSGSGIIGGDGAHPERDGRPTRGVDADDVLSRTKLRQYIPARENSYLCPALRLFEIPEETVRREREAIRLEAR